MTGNDDILQCGNCICFTLFNYGQEVGRCRRYNITTQLRTQCLNHEYWKCKCRIENCSEKNRHQKEMIQ